jgi:hypothetical protein
MKFPFTVPELCGPSFTVNGKQLTPFCLSTLLNDNVNGYYYMASVMNERMNMKQVFVLLWFILRGTAILRVV